MDNHQKTETGYLERLLVFKELSGVDGFASNFITEIENYYQLFDSVKFYEFLQGFTNTQLTYDTAQEAVQKLAENSKDIEEKFFYASVFGKVLVEELSTLKNGTYDNVINPQTGTHCENNEINEANSTNPDEKFTHPMGKVFKTPEMFLNSTSEYTIKVSINHPTLAALHDNEIPVEKTWENIQKNTRNIPVIVQPNNDYDFFGKNLNFETVGSTKRKQPKTTLTSFNLPLFLKAQSLPPCDENFTSAHSTVTQDGNPPGLFAVITQHNTARFNIFSPPHTTDNINDNFTYVRSVMKETLPAIERAILGAIRQP